MLQRNYRIHRFLRKQFLSTAATTTSGRIHHDVLICGGGVVGAALAADLLTKTKGACSVGLVELHPPKKEIKNVSDPPDIRVYALSPHSIKRLDELGAWKYIQPRSQSYDGMQIWESSGPGLLRFSAEDMKVKALGRICEDITIQSAIYQAIQDSGYADSLTTYYGSSVTDISLPDEPNRTTDYSVTDVTVQPKDTSQPASHITSRLLVGADGGNSQIRRLCGIPTWGWGYGQEAVVATVRLTKEGASTQQETGTGTGTGNLKDGIMNGSEAVEKDNGGATRDGSGVDGAPILRNTTAWQKYLPTGPLALLPLWDGYASIVWSTSVSESKRLKALPTEAFLAELNSALQTRPHTEKWSVFEPTDGITLPPLFNQAVTFLDKTVGLHQHDSRKLNPLQKLKQEVTAVADMLMAVAQMQDPLKFPPKVLECVDGRRVSFPLSFSQARRYTAARVAIVGDAAHSIHPQAGQGLNLGLLDAFSLSQAVVQAMQVGVDIGDPMTLQKYEKDRFGKNLGMMGIVDGINTMFHDPHVGRNGGSQSTKRVPVSALDALPKCKQFLRSVGMLGIHQLGPVKHKIAKFAMGLDVTTTSSKK